MVWAARCQKHLRLPAERIRTCAAEYDERLPLGERWTTCVDPYIHGTSLLVCPTSTDLRRGCAMTCHLSSVPARVIPRLHQTPMLFPSAFGARSALGHPGSAVARYSGGGNVAYADGHVAVAPSGPYHLVSV